MLEGRGSQRIGQLYCRIDLTTVQLKLMCPDTVKFVHTDLSFVEHLHAEKHTSLGELSLPSLRGKSSTSFGLLAGGKAVRVHLCRVAGDTVCDPIWQVTA